MTATAQQVQACFQTLRTGINGTGYGGWVSDATLMPWATKAANAVVAATPKPAPAPAPHPAPQPSPAPAPANLSSGTHKGE